MESNIDILIRRAKEKAKDNYPYTPSFSARPFPKSCGRRFWVLRALFLEHIKVYNQNGWRQFPRNILSEMRFKGKV